MTLSLTAALTGLSLSMLPPSLAGQGQTQTVEVQGPVRVGEPVPTFAGYDLQGEMLRWKDFLHEDPPSEEAIVIAAFASWCKPCVDGLKVLSELSQEDPQLRLLLVNFQESEEEAEKFLKKVGLSDTPTLIDQYGSISKRLGVTQALPRTFLVDGWGRTRTIFVSEGGDFEKVLKRELAALRELSSQEALRLQGQEVLDDMDETLEQRR